MLYALARKWWVLFLNGLCGIIFGVIGFVWPQITLWALVLLFGVYALGDGLTAIITASASRDESGRSWFQLLLVGVISILAGIIAVALPGVTVLSLLIVIAIWAIVRGITVIAAAIKLRKFIDNELMLILAGAVSILLGIAMIAQPRAGAVALIWWISAFSVVHGLLVTSLAFRVRKFKRAFEAAGRRPSAATD